MRSKGAASGGVPAFRHGGGAPGLSCLLPAPSGASVRSFPIFLELSGRRAWVCAVSPRCLAHNFARVTAQATA